MTPERWQLITGVFYDALAREPDARGAFLDQACGGDGTLRKEVERLLAAHQDAGRFGETAVPVTPGGPSLALDHDLPSAADAGAGPPHRGKRRPRAVLAVLWITAAATAAMFIYAAWVIAAGENTRSFGWREVRRAGNPRVAAVEATGPAAGRLQQGDRVIAVNGIPPIGEAGTHPHRRGLSIGDTYEITVERNGQQSQYVLPVVAGPNPLADNLGYFVVSLVWCAVGLFMGFARPERAITRLACASSVATGLVFLQTVTRTGPIFQPLHVILGFHFLLRFPADAPPHGIWKWALRVAYVCGGLQVASRLLLRGSALTLGVSAAADVAQQYPPLFDLRALGMVGYDMAVLGMVPAMVLNYRRLKEEDSRRRIRWVLYGTIVGLGLQVWWSAAVLLEGVLGPAVRYPLDPLLANALTAVIPICVAHAVVSHRMFDITVVVRRGLQYLMARRALQAAVVLPLAALVYTVANNRHLTIAELATETGGYLYWLAAAALMLRFRGPIQLWLDRRFFREEYDREHLLVTLLDDVGRVESISELSRLVSDRLEFALHPRKTYVWYRDPGELGAAATSDPHLTPDGFPSGARWLAWLEEHGAATAVPRSREAGLSQQDTGWFADRGISLIVPVADSHDRLVGALLLGDKKSEEPYTAGDRRLLAAIARQTALVQERLRLRARVSEDARVRHDVLARLDSSLPDLLKECPACGACFDGAVERCAHDGQRLILTLPVGRTIEGKYRLDRLIGKGGMGAVYEARDVRLDRAVAVKIMLGRAFGEQAAIRRFRREARAAARLNHRNIVGVHDVGLVEREGAYLVMELVQGVTLRAELDRDGAMPPAVAADWFDQLLDGIGAAHAAGIVHRDLKPENVIGRRQNGTLDVKILDLGLVKVGIQERSAGETMTAQGVVMGTIGYMSPEQCRGDEVDHRTDIFAVGIMVFEALRGRRPFEGDAGAGLAGQVQKSLSQLSQSSPETRMLADTLGRCLAADARDRFSSAASVRGELIPLLRRCPPMGPAVSV